MCWTITNPKFLSIPTGCVVVHLAKHVVPIVARPLSLLLSCNLSSLSRSFTHYLAFFSLTHTRVIQVQQTFGLNPLTSCKAQFGLRFGCCLCVCVCACIECMINIITSRINKIIISRNKRLTCCSVK